MDMTIGQVLKQAVAAHKEGNLQEAENLYRLILKTQPEHPDANHNLGMIAVLVNKVDSALALFKTALDSDPTIEQYWFSYIDALIKAGHFDNAKQLIHQGREKSLSERKLRSLESLISEEGQKVNPNVASPSPGQLNRLIEYYQSMNFVDAEKLALSISEDFPAHVLAWKILGVLYTQTGRHSDALNANKKAVKLSPKDANAQSNLGVSFRELGRLDEAEASLRLAIELEYDFVDAHNNLGNVFNKLGRLEEAEASLRLAITLKDDHADAYFNLGDTLKLRGKLVEAVASYRKVIALKPGFIAAHFNLGRILQGMGKLEEAEVSFRQTIVLKSDFAEAYYRLGNTLKELDKLKEAEASYRKALEIKADYHEARHILSALIGETTKAAPATYVEKLFDDYASDFEISLVEKLEYKTPEIITKMILKKHSHGSLGSVLDLGCGTGLTGEKIRKFCSYLEGNDISGKMLDLAKSKNIYDKLVKREILDYLSYETLDFDYFIATDVFVYLGDLSDVFQLIKSRNKSGGKMVFSTEDSHKKSFSLEQSGRYSHSKKYIESLCEKFNYKLTHFETQNLRKDKNHFITGGLFILDF